MEKFTLFRPKTTNSCLLIGVFVFLITTLTSHGQCPPFTTVSQLIGDTGLSTASIGQSFEAPTTGDLVEVAAAFRKDPAITDLTLNIYSGAGTSGTLLQSQPIDVSTIPIFGVATLSFPLTTEVPVVSGSTYTMEFVTTSGTLNPIVNNVNAYSDGTYFGNGTAVPTEDLVFEADICPDECNITIISTSMVSACDDGGTGSDPTDDTFTADITVTYSSPPATGTLDISGDNNAPLSVTVGALNSSTSHTFTGVTMSADGTAIGLTASFSDDAACTFTEPAAGLAPTSCSPECVITNISGDNISLCNNGGTKVQDKMETIHLQQILL